MLISLYIYSYSIDIYVVILQNSESVIMKRVWKNVIQGDGLTSEAEAKERVNRLKV